MADGWICLHRKIVEWEWYSDINVFRLFIHVLLKANHEDREWKGKQIKRGEFLTSRDHISQQTGLTYRQIRLCEEKLQKTGSMVIETTNKFTRYIIVRYEDYQSILYVDGKQRANKGQTKGKQRATTNNENNENNENNKDSSPEFENWWKAYPKNNGSKADALKSYNRAIKKGVTHERLLKAATDFKQFIAESGTERQFIPHSSTWLNGERWDNEYGRGKPEYDAKARFKEIFGESADFPESDNAA